MMQQIKHSFSSSSEQPPRNKSCHMKHRVSVHALSVLQPAFSGVRMRMQNMWGWRLVVWFKERHHFNLYHCCSIPNPAWVYGNRRLDFIREMSGCPLAHVDLAICLCLTHFSKQNGSERFWRLWAFFFSLLPHSPPTPQMSLPRTFSIHSGKTLAPVLEE